MRCSLCFRSHPDAESLTLFRNSPPLPREYRIHSIMPGMYEGPGDVHFEVWDGAKPKLSTWVGLYAAPGVPPVPGWEHTSSATREWKPTMGLFTVDSSGVYHCHKDLRLNQMVPVDARYDSLMKALRREDRGHRAPRSSNS